MADHAHSIPASDVHRLDGSSLPGAGTSGFEPVAGMLDSFTSIGDAAASVIERINEATEDDADLIAEAATLQDLIRNNDTLWGEVADAEPEHEDAKATAAHASGDIVRDASLLLAGKPAKATKAVAAKARALIEAAGVNSNSWYENLFDHVPLVLSTLRDAVTLDDQSRSNDARLFDLIAKQKAAEAEQDEANKNVEPLFKIFTDRRPPVPGALYWRLDDNLDCETSRQKLSNGNLRLFYDIPHVEKLREMEAPVLRREESEPAPWGDGDVIVKVIKTPDVRRAARIAEIIVAADDLMARTKALADEVGLTEANRLADEASYRANRFEDAIMATMPTSPAGWAAKAEWLVSRTWTENYLHELAFQMVTDMASLSADRQSEFGLMSADPTSAAQVAA